MFKGLLIIMTACVSVLSHAETPRKSAWIDTESLMQFKKNLEDKRFNSLKYEQYHSYNQSLNPEQAKELSRLNKKVSRLKNPSSSPLTKQAEKLNDQKETALELLDFRIRLAQFLDSTLILPPFTSDWFAEKPLARDEVLTLVRETYSSPLIEQFALEYIAYNLQNAIQETEGRRLKYEENRSCANARKGVLLLLFLTNFTTRVGIETREAALFFFYLFRGGYIEGGHPCQNLVTHEEYLEAHEALNPESNLSRYALLNGYLVAPNALPVLRKSKIGDMDTLDYEWVTGRMPIYDFESKKYLGAIHKGEVKPLSAIGIRKLWAARFNNAKEEK